MTRLENVNHTSQETNINQAEQQKNQRKELLSEMLEIISKTPEQSKIDFNCGLGLTNYYEKIKRELLSKHQQLVNNYRQSEIENDNHNNLTLVLADLRKNISLIDSIWSSDIREMTYYQKMALTTCRHLLKNE